MSSYGCFIVIYYCNVFCRLATSFYNYSIASTSLVWCAVYGGISILSKQLALYLALAILLFCAYKISSRSTGVGVASESMFVVPSPRSFCILDIFTCSMDQKHVSEFLVYLKKLFFFTDLSFFSYWNHPSFCVRFRFIF